MNHFMLDLETLGTTPGCAILSFGMIAFNPLAPTVDTIFADNGFYVVANRESCAGAFLHEEEGTLAWWRKQSPAARQVLADADNPAKCEPLGDCIEMLVDYVTGHCVPKEARVYGNGSDFDNPIVAVAARMAGVKVPWSYGGRCYRTLKSLDDILGPEFAAPKMQRGGTHHNALDDARDQALHLWEIINTIRSRLVRVGPA